MATNQLVSHFERSGMKPGHILVVFFFSFFAMYFMLRTGSASAWWPHLGQHVDIVARSGAIVISIAMFTLIPELRMAMAAMFRSPSTRFQLADFLVALALMFTWAIGVHAVVVKMPTVWLDSTHYLRFWGYVPAIQQPSVVPLLLLLVSTAVLAPILEEFYFRGMLFNAWRVRRSLVTSIVLSSFFFGIIHGRTTLLAFGFGVIACILLLRFHSLWPGIFVHGAYNALIAMPGMTTLIVQKNSNDSTSLSGWWFEIGLTIAFVPLAILFWRRFRPA